MKCDNKFKRLKGHETMKEIPENFDSDTPVAGIADAENNEAAAAATRSKRPGILGAICALLLAGGVFVLSYEYFNRKEEKQMALSGVDVNANAAKAGDNALLADYTVIDVTEVDEVDDGDMAATSDAVAGSDATATAAVSDEPDVVCLFPVNGFAINDNADLDELAKEAVAENADVTVTGYTDESGSVDYNTRLSAQRAQAVTDYLVAHGVPRDHIKTQGCGPTHAYASAALDRRVEVSII